MRPVVRAGRAPRARHCVARCENSWRKSWVASGESIGACVARPNGIATVEEALCSSARGGVCGSLLPCQAAAMSPSSTAIHGRVVPSCSACTSKMPDHTKYYILGAFLLGVALTAAHDRRSRGEASEDANSEQRLKQQHSLLSKLSKINDLDTLKKTLAELEGSLERGKANIKEGIEGCIGDTPLIKIKSLSDYTGCEILAKAEVRVEKDSVFRFAD
jgi:hypothetical protein